jgi:hypothetical protein
MSPLQRFQVLLKAEQLAALRETEQRTGTSIGALIRLAVDEWLAKGDVRKATSRRVSPRRKI